MAKLSAEVQAAMKKTMPTCIATASSEGVPNLVYVTYVKAVGDDTIVVADNKFDKTRSNLDSNPWLTVTVLDPDTKKAYQIKGKTECFTEGDKYTEVADWVHVNHPQMTPKAAFYMSVDEVYCGAERLA